MRRRPGGEEERVTGPNPPNVIEAEVGVFEQVRCLRVDLERIVLVEEIEIKPFHMLSVTTTSDYAFPKHGPHER